MKTTTEEFRKIKLAPPTAKQEYKLLPKEEKKIVDAFASVMRKYKRRVGPLKMVECLHKAFDLT